jgi:hypothetical protein
MEEEVQMSFNSLNRVFNKICNKVIDPNNMDVLKVKIVETMSILEKVPPPHFGML